MRIYANLLGNWTDITETGTVADCQNPVTYFTENLSFLEGSTVAECFKCDRIKVYQIPLPSALSPVKQQVVQCVNSLHNVAWGRGRSIEKSL